MYISVGDPSGGLGLQNASHLVGFAHQFIPPITLADWLYWNHSNLICGVFYIVKSVVSCLDAPIYVHSKESGLV